MRGIESMWGIALLGLCGIALLVFSAEKVVKYTLDLAHHYGLSELFIGLTIISIGTSIPEISSNIIGGFGILSGALEHHIASATIMGANVGSSIVQQTLIVGTIVVITGHLKFSRTFLAENYVALIATLLIVFTLSYDGFLSRSDSVIMLLVFSLYLYFLYRKEYTHRHIRYEQEYQEEKQEDHLNGTFNTKRTMLLLALGFFGVFISSIITLEAVQYIVETTGISGSLIGAMTLGVASALPEFITALSAVKKQSDGVSIGTLIGSNIVNPLAGLGAGGLIATYIVPHSFTSRDLPMQIITACILLLWVNSHHRTVPKLGGVILIMIYVIYLLVKMHWFGVDF